METHSRKPFIRQTFARETRDTILTPRSHSGVKVVLGYPNQDTVRTTDITQRSGSVQWIILRSQSDSSSVSRSIRTQMKTSDTGYNVHGYNVHVIQSYVKILDSTHQVVLDSPKHKFRYTREYFDQDVTSG